MSTILYTINNFSYKKTEESAFYRENGVMLLLVSGDVLSFLVGRLYNGCLVGNRSTTDPYSIVTVPMVKQIWIVDHVHKTVTGLRQ